MVFNKASQRPAELSPWPSHIGDRRLLSILSSHLRSNYFQWRQNPSERLSTLYAFAGQAGPQGQRRCVLISKPGILPARHHHRDRIDEVKNRGLRIGQVLSVLHTEVDSIRATWHLHFGLPTAKSRSRDSAVNVYICQGSLKSTALGVPYISWSITSPCIHYVRHLPSCTAIIVDPGGLGIGIWSFCLNYMSGMGPRPDVLWMNWKGPSTCIGAFVDMA